MTLVAAAVAALAQEAADAGGDGLDPSYLAGAAAILAAAITAVVAILVYTSGQREARRDRKRELCGKAIADALAWMELPHRIRRRVDDDGQTLHQLTGGIHDLQQSLLFYTSWLRVELPEAHEAYEAFVVAIKTATSQHLQDAWQSPPAKTAAGMNVGPLPTDHSEVDDRLAHLTAVITKHLG